MNTDYTLTEGHAIELCAQIEHGVLGKDMRVALNISLDAGKYLISLLCNIQIFKVHWYFFIYTASFDDFHLPSETLLFSWKFENSTSCILLHAIDDSIVEKNETFSVGLLDSEDVHTDGYMKTAKVLIQDSIFNGN